MTTPTREDIILAIRNADKAGDSASVRALGQYLQTMQSKPAKDPYDISADTSTGEKFLAGAGKAFADIGRGAGQLLRNVIPDKAANAIGLPTQEDIDYAKRVDAPLMRTTSGTLGNVTGNVAAALPAAFVPGGATLPGAALTGVAMGAVQPVASDESRMKNVAIGGAAGAGGVLAGRALKAGVQGARSLAAPFSEKGRQTIAGRVAERFGVTADDVAGLSGQPTITGAQPTLAESITRPEGAAAAARMQDAIRAVDPEIAARFAAREMENNAARTATLRELAGEGGEREFAETMRNTTARDLYGQAFSGPKITLDSLTKGEKGEVTKLMKMPAVQDAMKEARKIALNQGMKLDKPELSVEGLHLMKLAMDDAINNAGTSAAQVNKAMSIRMARDRLTNFIQRMSPEYAEARGTYAAMSKPLNEMDVAAEVLKRGSSATSDLAGNPRLMPNAMANALRDEGRLIRQATGRDLGSTLGDVMDPANLQRLQAVASEVDRAGAVARAANGPGSATAQRMASQNVLRQIMGPTGLPESWSESTLLNTVMRPVQFAYNGIAEPRIQQVVADMMLDPARAQAVLDAARRGTIQLSPEVQAALPYVEQALRVAAPSAAMAGQR